MKAPTNNQVPNILVLDLEMNQPSGKIIELGYVIGNPLNNEIFIRRSFFIDPKETISPFILELTHITQDMVDGSSTLDTAYDAMVKDVRNFSALTLIHQWGVPDAQILKKQLNNSPWIFGRRWIDVKALAQSHAIIHGNNFTGGLRKMAGRIGIQVSREQAHRADYDAEMTFLVHGRLSRFFLLPFQKKNRHPTYKQITSVLHNFVRSFFDLVDEKRNFFAKKLLKAQLSSDRNLEFQILPKLLSKNVISEPLLAALSGHIRKLESLFEKAQSSIALISEMKVAFSIDDGKLSCEAFAQDDRGKQHRIIVLDNE